MPLQLFGDFGLSAGFDQPADPYQNSQLCINYYPEISPSQTAKEPVALLGSPGLIGLVSSIVSNPEIHKVDWQGNQLQYSTPRTNYCVYSQALTSPNWHMGIGTATTTGGQTDPSGGTTASSIACTVTGAFVNTAISVTTSPSTNVTDSIWMKGAAGGENVDFGDNYNAGGIVPYTLTTSWQRYTYTGASPSGNHGIQININAGSTIYVAFCQVEIGSTVTPYIPTTSGPVTVTDYSYNVGGTQIVFATAPILGSIITGVYENGGYIFSIGTGDGTTTDFDVPTSNTIELAVPQNIYSNGSPYHAFSITPSDTAMLAACTLKIYAGGTGAISVILNRDDIDHPFTFQAVAHTFYDIAASQVLATGTTATGIIGLN